MKDNVEWRCSRTNELSVAIARRGQEPPQHDREVANVF